MTQTMTKTPIRLWIDALENSYWQETGGLRRRVNDPQICGYGYCPLGVLCDLFIRHAPEAALVKARWEDYDFVWEERGAVRKEHEFLPLPVALWWERHHHDLTLTRIAEFSDNRHGSFKELAMYLRGMERMPYLSPR